MLVLADIFALLCAVAGWFYLFYSKAAARLVAVECARHNAIRVRLRRINGVAMLVLAVAFFAGFNSVDDKRNPLGFVVLWIVVMLMLLLVSVLAAVDLRMTGKLRHRLRVEKHS